MTRMALVWTDQHQAMSYLIAEHCDSLVLTHSPSTINDRRRLLWALHRELPGGLAWATADQIRDFLANKAWSDNTRHTYGAHIVEAFRWWYARGWLLDNACANLKTPPPSKGRPRPIGGQYLAVLLAEPEPLPTIVLLGAYEGMRRAEIADSCREHITEELVLIPNAKGGQAQTVPTHPLVWAHLRDRPPGPLIVGRRSGRQLDPDQLGDYWLRARRRLGLPDTLVPHQLRHRFGTEVRRAHDVLVAKKALRHSSLSSTEIYTEVDSDEVAQAIRSLPAVEHRPAATRPVPPAQAA